MVVLGVALSSAMQINVITPPCSSSYRPHTPLQVRLCSDGPSADDDAAAPEPEPVVNDDPAAAVGQEDGDDEKRSRLVADVLTIVQSAAITGAFYYIIINLLDPEWLAAPVGGLPGTGPA